MKIKEIDRMANIAWSPSSHQPIYLVAGTAAQQLDATFSTTASLEVFDLNLNEPGLDMSLKGSIVSDYRFHKIAWGCAGLKQSELSSGVIVGGADGGNLLMYDPAKLLAGENALLHHKTNHSGAVHSLDFNKFQECLLASGGSESEIFIWDLYNPTTPMTPGAKAQPTEDVTCVAWNHQVQHILASTFPARCIVWDLRKNEPIIRVSDSAARMRCKTVAWHPEVATQLCLASDDDHCPLIQLWDLRFATTPVRSLDNHQRGILSIAWCPQDPDLLLSCGKDSRILCWNPNSSVEGGEIVWEMPTSSQWNFDVAWCLRNPAVFASSSCDGRVAAYSLMGGQTQTQCSAKIAESFPGSERIIQPQIATSCTRQTSISLKKPPKWLRKPVRASFAFGGRLVSFLGPSLTEYKAQDHGLVYISQVVTEPVLLQKANQLESVLSNGNVVDFCISKAESCSDPQEKIKWNFLEATFSSSPRSKMLSLLGYDYQNVSEVSRSCSMASSIEGEEISGTEDLANGISNLSTHPKQPSSGSMDGKNIADFDEIAVGAKDMIDQPFIIKTDRNDNSGLLNIALLAGNIQAAVDICINDKRWADALVLSQAGGYDLIQRTQQQYFKSVSTPSSKLISAVATSNWASIIRNCQICSWKECLAAILTYAKPEEFSSLCEILGNRLESEGAGTTKQNAALCYISSGNLERLAELWMKTLNDPNDVSSLEHLVEQIMVLRQAVEQLSGSTPSIENGILAKVLGQFASLLASQGNLQGSLRYFVDAKEHSLAILRDQVYQCLGLQSPFFPFKRISISVNPIAPEPQHVPNQQIRATPYQTNFHQERKQSYPDYQQQIHQNLQQFQSSVPHAFTPMSMPSATYQTPTPVSQFQPHAQQTFPSNSVPQHVLPPNSYSKPNPPPMLNPTSMSQQVLNPNTMAQTVPPPVNVPPPPPTSDMTNLYTGKTGSSSTPLSQRYPKHLHDPSVYSENTSYGSQQYYPQQSTYSVLQQPEHNFNQRMAGDSHHQTPMNYYQDHSMTTSFSMNSCVPTYQPPVSSYQGQQVPSKPPSVIMDAPPLGAYAELTTGWNDPPLLTRPADSSIYEPSQPAITTPLLNAPEILQPAIPSSMGHPTQMQSYENSYSHPPTLIPGQITKELAPVAQQVVPDSPKEKSLPPQHQILQDTFEDLRHQCQQVATNPQTKRKLEDVARKLETLYDKLKEKSLSSNVEDGIHQIVQSILQGDYSSALGVHGSLVSSCNFSEVSGFLPSVKVLLQTAAQHNVYLQ